MANSTLRKHLLVGAGGSVAIAGVGRLLSVGSAVILARALAPSGYGVYMFAISVVGLLQIPAQFGMSQLVPREVAAGEATGRWDLVHGVLRWSIRFVTLCTAVTALVTIGALWLVPAHLSYGRRVTWTLAVGFMIANAYGALSAASLTGLRRVIVAQLPMGIGRPALFLAGVAAIGLLARGKLSPLTAMGTNAAAAGVMLAVSVVVALRSFRIRAHKVAPSFDARRWLVSALPFALLSGVWVLNSRTDMVLLGVLANSRDVGIYSVAAVGAGLTPLVLGAVNGAIGPTLAGLYATGDRRRLARIVRLTALAGLVGGTLTFVVFAVWGRPLIRAVFGPAYVLAWLPLVILGLGQLANAGTGPAGLVLNMTGHERDSFLGLVAAMVVNIGLNLLLIPRMGADGAALATALSIVARSGLLAWRVKRHLGFLPFGSGLAPLER